MVERPPSAPYNVTSIHLASHTKTIPYPFVAAETADETQIEHRDVKPSDAAARSCPRVPRGREVLVPVRHRLESLSQRPPRLARPAHVQIPHQSPNPKFPELNMQTQKSA